MTLLFHVASRALCRDTCYSACRESFPNASYRENAGCFRSTYDLNSHLVVSWLLLRSRDDDDPFTQLSWPSSLRYPGPQPKTLEVFLTFSSFTLDTDCEEYGSCAGYSFLHWSLPVVVFSFDGDYYSFGLAYDAYAVWDNVTCLAVIDANTDARNCCGFSYADDPCVDNRLGFWSDGGHAPFVSPYCSIHRFAVQTPL